MTTTHTIDLWDFLDATMRGDAAKRGELLTPPQGVGSTDTPEGPQQARTPAAPVFRLIRGGCGE